jgi:hypothetical protein
MLTAFFNSPSKGYDYLYLVRMLKNCTKNLYLCHNGQKNTFQAHAPLPCLYEIDQSKLDLQEVLQLQTFLNKLTCNRIGFTAWKTFTVNYEAVLTVLFRMNLSISDDSFKLIFFLIFAGDRNVCHVPDVAFSTSTGLGVGRQTRRNRIMSCE